MHFTRPRKSKQRLQCVEIVALNKEMPVFGSPWLLTDSRSR